MSDRVVICGPELAAVLTPEELATLLERHWGKVARVVDDPGRWYSQYRLLVNSRLAHVVVCTDTRKQEETVCALREEWTSLMGEAPPAWPARN